MPETKDHSLEDMRLHFEASRLPCEPASGEASGEQEGGAPRGLAAACGKVCGPACRQGRGYARQEGNDGGEGGGSGWNGGSGCGGWWGGSGYRGRSDSGATQSAHGILRDLELSDAPRQQGPTFGSEGHVASATVSPLV